jgi:hypothetical protein
MRVLFDKASVIRAEFLFRRERALTSVCVQQETLEITKIYEKSCAVIRSDVPVSFLQQIDEFLVCPFVNVRWADIPSVPSHNTLIGRWTVGLHPGRA